MIRRSRHELTVDQSINMTPMIDISFQLILFFVLTSTVGQAMDAATAGHVVGYDSPSQFSREYARLFGAPPARDIAKIKASPDRTLHAG